MTTTGYREVKVANKTVEAEDICLIELVSPDGILLEAFSAGAHIDLNLPNGLSRQYSLCNDPRESHRYLIAVLKDPASRGGSKSVHDDIHIGDTIRISTPKNHFPLVRDAGHSVLLAGGIGVTPILAMAEQLATIDASFHMHYCTRSVVRTAFCRRIESSRFSKNVSFHFDDGPADQKLDLNAALGAPTPGTHIYVCGPQGFMDAVLTKARSLSWGDDQLHYEFFSGTVLKLNTDESFTVELARSRKVVRVAKDQTVIQALSAAGVVVPTSCEEGTCGTCLLKLLAGEPDHRDLYLTPDEHEANDQFIPCCSRAKSPSLVLDI